MTLKTRFERACALGLIILAILSLVPVLASGGGSDFFGFAGNQIVYGSGDAKGSLAQKSTLTFIPATNTLNATNVAATKITASGTMTSQVYAGGIYKWSGTFTALAGGGYHCYAADTTSVACYLYAPDATTCAVGQTLIVLDSTNSANTHNITIYPYPGQKIGNSSANSIISTGNGALRMITDGSNWFKF